MTDSPLPWSLYQTANDLDDFILQQPWAQVTAKSPSNKQRFILLVGRLRDLLLGYDTYLDGKKEARAAQHNMTEEEVALAAAKNRILKPLPRLAQPDRAFKALTDALKEMDLFKPVLLLDIYPTSKGLDKIERQRNERLLARLRSHGHHRRLQYLSLGGGKEDGRATEYVWLVPREGDARPMDAPPVDLTESDVEADGAASVVEVARKWTAVEIVQSNEEVARLLDLFPSRRRSATRYVCG
jgi:hypothetical protein